MYDRLRAALPNAKFFPPATTEQIARVEKGLQIRFPDWLRELYLHCNGIRGTYAIYLYALERNDDFSESLLNWNLFHRDLWQENLDDAKQNRPEIDWDGLDPRNLLIIGSDNGLDWAIKLTGETSIVNFDVRNPDDREIVAKDLVEACVANERQEEETHEDLFRGREQYCRVSKPWAEMRDIDRLFELILTIYTPSGYNPGDIRLSWYFDRAISQRAGETGELFIIKTGSDEIRIATRDGNFPFVMRLSAWPMEQELICSVHDLKDALMRVLAAHDAISLPWKDANERPRPDEAELHRIWRSAGREDAELFEIAEVLCRRDDKRRVEDNRLG